MLLLKYVNFFSIICLQRLKPGAGRWYAASKSQGFVGWYPELAVVNTEG